MKIGAWYLGNDRCEFTVWAPLLKQVAVKLVSPTEQVLPLQKNELGYWQTIAAGVAPGTRYVYQLEAADGSQIDRPDPASQLQPEGVHSASAVVDQTSFVWADQDWQNIPQSELIIYELHVGTFTPAGTFAAIIPRLPELKELGINAIELMPIAQFPGSRNWGYDGVYPYAVQDSYGGPEGLKQLVNACHQQGIAVVLDAVYNHFGPEGNYVGDFAPYFTQAYKSAWGNAINFDQTHSHGVRSYFIENALYWFEHFHIDMLRLDASDTIFDYGAKHFLRELSEAAAALGDRLGRKFYLVAENDLSDVRVVSPIETGGYGLDGQWNDAFHHCLRTVLTGETMSYYADYGTCAQLAKAIKQGFVFSWEFSPFRQKWYGSDSSHLPGEQFVVFCQNHDQVGNRVLGDRLSASVPFDALKVAAATVMLSPYVPLIFMGEEYAEEAPFLYFVSHSDPELIEAVRKGRRQEFEAFHLEDEYADPESTETFERSRLDWHLWQGGKHKVLRDWYRHLIQLRRTISALKQLDKQSLEVEALEDQKLLVMQRWHQDSRILAVLNYGKQDAQFQPPAGDWQKILDSAEDKWMGAGATLPDRFANGQASVIGAHSVALYQ